MPVACFLRILACAGCLLAFSHPLWGSWKTLRHCTLVDHPGNDGDSFHVRHEGKEYIFRLYYADSPETSSMFPQRIKDQAAYFGISPSRITSLGKEAADFTRSFLSGTFTVRTEWEDARGRSRLPRYYAIIEHNEQSLAEALISSGLARIYGYTPNARWQGGPSDPWDYQDTLKDLEKSARGEGFGAWGNRRKAPPLSPDHTRKPSTTPRDNNSDSAEASTDKLNVNSVSAQSLQRIPGIGPVLAERIIAGRPYRSLNELKDISGIGPALFQNMEGHLILYSGEPPRYTSDFYARNPERHVYRNILLYVDYVEPLPEADVPEGYSVLWAQTSNEGISGGGIAVYFPKAMREDFLQHYGTQETYAEQAAPTGRAPPRALTGGLYPYDGQLILVIRPISETPDP